MEKLKILQNSPNPTLNRFLRGIVAIVVTSHTVIIQEKMLLYLIILYRRFFSDKMCVWT